MNLTQNIKTITSHIKPSQSTQDKLTLWLNHLLVIYAFLIPVHNKAKTSVFFVMLLLFLYRMNFVKYLKDALSNKIVQAFIIFYLVWLFGFLYTENLTFAKDSISKAKYLLFPLFFLSFLDKRFSYRVMSAFILGMLFSELISYAIRFEFLPHVLYVQSYEIYTALIHDPSPFFKHTDHNIGLAIVVALLLYQLLNKKLSITVKLISIFFIITASLNMTFIGSRTGYIMYLFLVTVVLLITYRKNIKKAILLALIGLIPIVFIAYNYSTMINKRVNRTITSINKIIYEDNYSSSIGKRIGATKYSLIVIKENPILGVGTGDYMDELRNSLPPEHEFIGEISQPHNVYIKTLLQFGIVGLLALFFLFYRLFTYKDCDSYNKGIIVILTSAVMLFMLPGKFYGYFVLPMFVTIVSAMIVKKQQSIEYHHMNQKTYLYYILVTIIFLIIGITK